MKPEVTQIVRNQSSREGGRPKLIVLHTTEGGDSPEGDNDLKGLAGWFDNTAAQASSHTANNSVGHDARFVEDDMKAWAVCYLNPVTLSIEQIAFAAFTREQWFARDAQLANTAAWIAHWSEAHGIPIRRGSISGIAVAKSGVCQHRDLGELGCGHSDCGDGYPMRYVLLLARYLIEERRNPDSRRRRRLRGKLNRVRKHYGLKPLG